MEMNNNERFTLFISSQSREMDLVGVLQTIWDGEISNW